MSYKRKTVCPERGETNDVLVQRAQAGCQDSFVALLERHRPMLWRVAYRMTANGDDALDVCQEIIIRIWRGLPKYRGADTFGAWARRIAVNEAIRWGRRRRGDNHCSIEDVEIDRVASAQCLPNARAALEDEERRMRIKAAMGALSPKQRAAISLRVYEEMSLAEIAETMGCGLGTVKRHLFRAMGKLRRILGKKEQDNEQTPD